MLEDFEKNFQKLALEVMSGMKEWRIQHPKATLREIESVLDERMGRMRANLLEDLALASKAADLRASPQSERAVCPNCGTTLEARGQLGRKLTTHYDQTLELNRSYAYCRKCQEGFFPP